MWDRREWMIGSLTARSAKTENHLARNLIHDVFDILANVVGAQVGAHTFDAA